MFGFPVPNFTFFSAPESFRDVIVHVPAGFVGNPTATPVRCTVAQLTQPSRLPGKSSAGLPARQPDRLCHRQRERPRAVVQHGAADAGCRPQFGFYYQGVIVYLRAKLRPADNGIDIITAKAPELDPGPQVRGDVVGRAV